MCDFSRTERLIGKEKLNILKNSNVCLFGVGGVGGFTAEALVRSGVGNLTVVDGDVVSPSNVNRQIIADNLSINKSKVEVIKERLLNINPNLKINAVNLFYLPEVADKIDLSKFDYVIDAIDTVSAKVDIISRCNSLGVKVISCMGTGGKIDIEKLTVTDIFSTKGCPLARVMRSHLRKRGVEKLKVVYSPEEYNSQDNNRTPCSMIFVPAVAGLMLARTVVFDLIEKGEK